MLKRLVRLTKSNPFLPATELKKELDVRSSVENYSSQAMTLVVPEKWHILSLSMLQNDCRSQKHIPRKSGKTCYGEMSSKLYFLVDNFPYLLFAGHLIVNTSPNS